MRKSLIIIVSLLASLAFGYEQVIPVVAKAIGNFQEETWKILEEGGVTVIKTIPTDQAVEELFKRLGK